MNVLYPRRAGHRTAALFLTLLFAGTSRGDSAGSARNIIICIGDGMGPEQVRAARYYAGNALVFESFPYISSNVTTHSANRAVTDSAAAATAIATGVKVSNGVISMAYPGDQSELETLLEYYQAMGKRTGLVTTTAITHATPAAFAAHELSRNNYAAIGIDYFQQTRPHVLLGGNYYTSYEQASSAGYTTVTNAAQLLALQPDSVDRLAGLFGSNHLRYEFDGMLNQPHLSEMTVAALDVLDNGTNGVFMVVEGGRIDHACHGNDLQRALFEAIEFNNAILAVLAWAETQEDVLVVVTADHETGGLSVLQDNGAGNLPSVSWSTTGHTATPVGTYAWGSAADLFGSITDNTELNTALRRAHATEPVGLSIHLAPESVASTFWQVVAGRTYQLTFTAGMTETNWTTVSSQVIAPVDTLQFEHSTTNSCGFYRLQEVAAGP